MLQFIQNNSEKKQNSYRELIDDLTRSAGLIGADLALSKLAEMPSTFEECLSEQRHSETYITAVELLSAEDDFFSKFGEAKRKIATSSKSPKFADLFCGAGGMSEGFTQAGFNCQFANDIDQRSAETFYLNHDINHENVYVGPAHELLGPKLPFVNKLGEIDLVIGGPPCQGFSTANRQRLIDDPRNHLYKDFIAFLARTRPKFFVIENVVGMAKRIDDIKQDVKDMLCDEYDIDFTFLRAADFGSPQNRRRFILIANRIGAKSESIIADIRGGESHFLLGDALLGLPPLEPKTEKNAPTLENERVGYKIRKSGRNFGRTKFPQHINHGERPSFILNHKNRYNNQRDVEIFSRLPKGENSLHQSIADIMPYSSRNHIFKDKYYKLDDRQLCKTITSHMKFDCNMYIHPGQPRGLSAREAARVQTFPDGYFFRGPPNSWYSQVGNAVPVTMSRAIAKSILSYL